MDNVLLNSLQDRFFLSFSMLEKILEICPDELWNKKVSGFVFWQQLLHTFHGVHFWFRGENSECYEPFKDLNVYPELEKEPENVLSKDIMIHFCKETKAAAEKWFEQRDDDWLARLFFDNAPFKDLEKFTNNDVITEQIRHIMYHVGHCDAIFRENGITTGEWQWYV